MQILFKYAGYDLIPIKENNPSIKQSENKNLKEEELSEMQVSNNIKKSQDEIQQKIKEIKEKLPNKVFDLESAQYFNRMEDIGTGAQNKYMKVSMDKFYTLKENLISGNIQQLIDEFDIMSELKHQNILKTHGIFFDLKKIKFQFYLIIIQSI